MRPGIFLHAAQTFGHVADDLLRANDPDNLARARDVQTELAATTRGDNDTSIFGHRNAERIQRHRSACVDLCAFGQILEK